MTDAEINVLRILRVFGPISNADVARKIRPMTLNQTYRIVCKLVDKGLAIHPRLQRWDISELGRDYFKNNGINEVRLFQPEKVTP